MDMDVNPCANDNFYDEVASFMPPPGEYSFDDFDEILRSTEQQLDSTLDFNALINDFNVDALNSVTQPELPTDDNYKFNFAAFPSPATSNHSSCTPPYGLDQSQRSISICSTDDDNFNAKELVNFFADDDVNMDDFLIRAPKAYSADAPQRSTPSPTGSCSSSGDSSSSSTSGVQSDFSSVVSTAEEVPTMPLTSISNVIMPSATIVSPPTAVLPVSVLPPPTATIVQPVQPITLIPVMKAMPIGTATNAINSPAPVVKVEPKLAPKIPTTTTNTAPPPIKTVTSTNTANTGSNQNTAKITPPPNAKPKTIFLSSKDFKALMQKMNTTGSTGAIAAKGAKITGNVGNSQMPKIIMKTPNGKVITANKHVIMQQQSPVSSSNATVAATPAITTTTAAAHFMPKIVKNITGGGHIVKPQPSKVTTVNAVAAAAAAARASHGLPPDLSMYKGIIDDKMLKKQQRMIKNRESASLSRKKKKEYVVSLETRINNLEKENYTLKGENSSLRSQLVAYAQTCQCKHSNISEFILNSLNVPTKSHESHHIKIAPKPSPRSLKQRMMAANVRKNVAVLFAMAFMVTLNVGNFHTYFNKNSIENSIEAASEAAAAAAAASASSAETLTPNRQLLWVESETEFQEKLHRNKREVELKVQPPPLHFLRPVNRTTGNFGNATEREPPLNCSSSATISANQTEENMRLVNKLHKWIGGNDYLNLSLHEKYDNELDESMGFKLTPDYMAWKSLELQNGPGSRQKRKIFLDQAQYERKQRKMNSDLKMKNGIDDDHDDDNDNGNESENERNSLELFKPKLSDEYVRLFKGIKRQDDTFYVLSFNMDHILLPASVYNKSARPKMSLMLPAGDPSLNGDVVLMQIDCEVVNTTELELKSHMIPEKLRPHKYKNNATYANPARNTTDVVSNETRTTNIKATQKAYAPGINAVGSSKEKPSVVRTYYMMGPKTQGAMNKKPTIVKLNGNESVVNVNPLNMRNSTLFAKMRETIENEAAAEH